MKFSLHIPGATNDRDLSGMGEQVPGLPPYTPATNHDTAVVFPADQNSAIPECISRAHPSPYPANNCVSHSANPCSAHSIASFSQEPFNNTQNTSGTDYCRNINSDNTERNLEHLETSRGIHRTIPP